MLKWLLFDLNSFFASCEQQEDPTLRGRPVAVIPTMAENTSVIAASYEAKRMGVKTNTLVKDARKLCPGIVFKTGNHKLYTEYHHSIVKAVEEVLPIKKTLSIDEVACELIGRERQPDEARRIAQQMKDHVRAVVGSEIKSSVGVGPNILIAKIASDMQKPDGLVLVDTPDIANKIGPLPIEALPGVGRKMKVNLNAKGYFTINDFIKTPEQELRKHWGSIWGLRVARELHGEDIPLNRTAQQRSFSHQHVLPPKFRNSESAFQILIKLLSKAAFRLREERFKAGRLSVYIKSIEGHRFENSIAFSETSDSQFLITQLKELFQPYLRMRPGKPIKVAMVLSDLSDGPTQLSLFDNHKNIQMNAALDSINSRFGPNTLFVASTKGVLSSAKTRIAFNHIPKLSDEFDEDL